MLAFLDEAIAEVEDDARSRDELRDAARGLAGAPAAALRRDGAAAASSTRSGWPGAIRARGDGRRDRAAA